MTDDTVLPTRTEVQTNILMRRFRNHVQQWWPRLVDTVEPPDFDFCVEDRPYQIWKGKFLAPGKGASDQKSLTGKPDSTLDINACYLWFLWDGAEVRSFATSEEAYYDLVQGQKARRLNSKFKYLTSPLTISAVLAVLLLCLIAGLEITHQIVPDQLWSIFTAVVAFYFGRESNKVAPPAEE